MPQFFGNNYSNIGTTENPIYRSTSSGGGTQLSIDGALTGAIGFLYFSWIGSRTSSSTPISGNYNITNGTAYDVTPGATYRFCFGSVNLDDNGVGASTITALETTMNPVTGSITAPTTIFRGECLGGYNNTFVIDAYIHEGKLQVLLTSQTGNMSNYIHSGNFMVLESF